MKTFMFPGQGSQAKGMGETLFDEFPELVKKADEILGYSVKELCLKDPRKELNKTQFTQPALYVVNALSYLKKVQDSGQKPDYVAGHSLGEFNALLAAECFDFEAGLKLVKKRSELMSGATGGGMAAILNASKQEIESVLEQKGLTGIDLANFNTPSQIVISGPRDEIGKAQQFFQHGEVLYYPLNTSGAFHSRYMQPVKEKYATYLKKFKFAEPKIPVISNVTGKPYQPDEILANLSSQIVSPVKWTDTIEYLVALGDMEFEEIGYGDVLTKLVHKIRSTNPQPAAEKEVTNPQDSAVKTLQQSRAPKTEQEHQRLAEISKKEAIKPQTVQEKVNAWNKKHPAGTRVKSFVMDGDTLETRTEAIVLFGHRASVYMKGYNGYFDLDELAPLG